MTGQQPAARRSTCAADEVSEEGGLGMLRLRVNGREHLLVEGRDFELWMTLGHVLRERLGLIGLKLACAEGACGACTVIVDGRAVLSCLLLAVECEGREVLTIEGLAPDDPVAVSYTHLTLPTN